jgi:flagellar basal body-associated protein FliL
MGNRKFVPQVDKHLGNIADVLAVISILALIVTFIIWFVTITSSDGYSSYERSSLSGLEAFGFIIYSMEGIIVSFVLRGFSFVVKAAIKYLDEKGEFDEKEVEAKEETSTPSNIETKI